MAQRNPLEKGEGGDTVLQNGPACQQQRGPIVDEQNRSTFEKRLPKKGTSVHLAQTSPFSRAGMPRPLRTLKPGTDFGERALTTCNAQGATITTKTSGRAYALKAPPDLLHRPQQTRALGGLGTFDRKDFYRATVGSTADHAYTANDTVQNDISISLTKALAIIGDDRVQPVAATSSMLAALSYLRPTGLYGARRHHEFAFPPLTKAASTNTMIG